MFQENLLRYKLEPVLFILNGPISSDAPYATEEHPGPFHFRKPEKYLKNYQAEYSQIKAQTKLSHKAQT